MKKTLLITVSILALLAISPLEIMAETASELDAAKERIKKHGAEEKRTEAAIKALETMINYGVEIKTAQTAVIKGLDSGLAPDDFPPLGEYAGELHDAGLTGKDLTDAINAEIKRRQEAGKTAKEEK